MGKGLVNLSDKFLIIKRLETEEQRAALIASNETDPIIHPQLFPSHVCYLGGEIIGSLSCCTTPVCGIWAHSKKSNARYTREMFSVARNITRSLTSGKPALTMCAETSPLYPFMERMDFIKLGPTVIFLAREG